MQIWACAQKFQSSITMSNPTKLWQVLRTPEFSPKHTQGLASGTRAERSRERRTSTQKPEGPLFITHDQEKISNHGTHSLSVSAPNSNGCGKINAAKPLSKPLVARRVGGIFITGRQPMGRCPGSDTAHRPVGCRPVAKIIQFGGHFSQIQKEQMKRKKK